MAWLDLLFEVLVLDAPGSFSKRATPDPFGSIDRAGYFRVQLAVARAISTYRRHFSWILNVGLEVLVSRDALKVSLRVLAQNSTT